MNLFSDLRKELAGWFNLSELLLMLITTLPCLAMFWISGDHIWLKLGLVSIPLYIVQAKLRWGIFPLLGHWLLILTGFTLLYFTQDTSWRFALLCACLGACSIGLGVFGQKLRSLGSWILIPSLYLACDLYDAAHPQLMLKNYMAMLPKLPVTLIGPVLVLIYEYLKSMGQKTDCYPLLWMNKGAFGSAEHSLGWTVAGIFIAIFVTALSVKLLGINHGQWVIWSSVSVSTGELESMHRKLRHRSLGAIIGLALGIGWMFLIPQHSQINGLAAMLIPLTLVIRSYPVSFTSRCMLIAIAAGTLSQSETIATLRMLNVMAGGIIGVLCAYLMMQLSHYYQAYRPNAG
ncbi:FUSC family protein [Dongshaea marina]|uniref:FUSC family protein n=1 Tax=Dongshaea marina TaxID=2047966 RepID=UPI00131F2B80|nr:FUSC family protein [Dongshaea marina]